MSDKPYDFGGWATKNNLRCSDGRTILRDAFKHNDGDTVPLVWNHSHGDPKNVLGHAVLENRDDGVYAYCFVNDTENGQTAKSLVQHGDIVSLSIYANQLQEQGKHVLHGAIREVSLVHAGANPGAMIDVVMRHGEESEDEAVIFTGEEIETEMEEEEMTEEELKEIDDIIAGTITHSAESEETETIGDIFNGMSEKQKNAVYAMLSMAIENDGGNEPMKHNMFDNDYSDDGITTDGILTHGEINDMMPDIISDAKRYGSLKDAFLQHDIGNIEYLFPDAQSVTDDPLFISREMGWVSRVMSALHKTPFSRIKSLLADITPDDARAKGYIKGNLKKDEVFSLLKRTTSPTTIYKKQKIDRDDLVDITDFDTIGFIKKEMRIMLDEEIARAVLVGDGRLSSSDDKIKEDSIRPVWTDADLYTVKAAIPVTSNATDSEIARAFIKAAIKSRKDYKGSGSPTLYTTEDMLTNCLLIEDTTGRVIYDSVSKLATTLRVADIITVPVMENLSRSVDGVTHNLMGIIVNLADYNIGADKGGAVNMFEDFDIDYNKNKYLIETRASGALIKPFSAIALESYIPA